MATMTVAVLAAPALAAPGEVDTSFGVDGVAVVTMHEGEGSTFHVSDVVVADDGTVVMLGGILRLDLADDPFPGFEFDLAVARLDGTGQLDPAFGTDGVVRLDAGGFDLPAQLAVEGTGRILFSANRLADDGTVTAVVGRLTADGALDEAYGDGGTAALSGAPSQYAGELVVDEAGRATVASVAAEEADDLEGAAALVTRLTTDGAPDPTFGSAGTSTIIAGRAGALGLDAAPDGGYLVTGSADDLPFVARTDAAGRLVSTFGNEGVARVPVTGAFGVTLHRADDGDVVLGGFVGPRSGLVARLDADGRPDTSFGRGGIRVVRADDAGAMPVLGLAPGPDGTWTFTGPRIEASPQATVGRLLPSGLDDAGFGGDGYVRPLSGPDAGLSVGFSVDADPTGRVVAAGIVGDADGSTVDAFATRFRAVAPGAPVTGTDVRRVAGTDRIATAVELSRSTFADADASDPGGRNALSVVLASASRFPDALVAAPYAAATEAPLLLNPAEALDPRVRAEIARVLPADGGRVTLMGGVGVISPAVEAELRAAGYAVERLGGSDRYETSVLVSEALAPSHLLIARGDAFPDALAAGPAAAEIGGAVLLTAGDELTPSVADHIAGNPDLPRYAVGGRAAAADPGAEPLVGGDRYATAAVVVGRFFHTPPRTVVASGEVHPDALAGGTLAALTGSPLLLTLRDSLPAVTDEALRAMRPFHRRVTVAGGTRVVTDAVSDAVARATS